MNQIVNRNCLPEFVTAFDNLRITDRSLTSGANGLDGGYETHVACRGSIPTQKDGTNTNANNELALAA